MVFKDQIIASEINITLYCNIKSCDMYTYIYIELKFIKRMYNLLQVGFEAFSE